MRVVTTLRLFAVATCCQLLGCALEPVELPTAPQSPMAPELASRMLDDAAWSEPVRLGDAINTPFNEQGPALSPDGLSLYFCSNKQPGGQGGNDIWVSRRASEDSPWEPAINLGPTVNSSSGDCGPNLSADGHLLFLTSNRSGGPNDLYVSWRKDARDDLAWEAPQPLGPDVNTPAFEFSPFFLEHVEDGPTNLYFERGPSNVATDIFAAAIKRSGETSGPAVPVLELNSPAADGHPTVRKDGREVFIHSNRSGVNFDIYVATRRSVHDPWSSPVRVTALSTDGAHEIHPSLSRDGRTIVFTRGQGTANDIWMSVRAHRGRWAP
jgi:Tol biopolymer transport system component